MLGLERSFSGSWFKVSVLASVFSVEGLSDPNAVEEGLAEHAPDEGHVA